MVRFFDPKNWTDEKNYGNDAITSFVGHFQVMLAAARYDSTKVHNEFTLKFGAGTRKLKISFNTTSLTYYRTGAFQ